MKYKIIVVGNTHVEHGAEGQIVKALKNAGHEVWELVYPTYQGSYDTNNNLLESMLQSFKPDFVLCSKVIGLKAEDLIRLKKEYKVPFVQWIFDKMAGFRMEERTKWWYPQAKEFDIVFNAEDQENQMYRNKGINHHILREGLDEEIHLNLIPSIEDMKLNENDVIFSGHVYNEFRKQMIKELVADNDIKFKHIIKDHGVKLSKIASCSKISINTNYDDFSDSGWSSRLVEHMGMGLMMLAPHIPSMDKEGFIDKENIVYYEARDLTDLKEKIKYYLEHEDERKKIAEKGYQLVIHRHTWDKRIEQLFEILKKEKIISNMQEGEK